MNAVALRAAYVCAAVSLGLLALHFNAERLGAWTRDLNMLAGGFAVPGAILAAAALSSRGWASLRGWPEQLALGLNVLLALGFIAYP